MKMLAVHLCLLVLICISGTLFSQKKDTVATQQDGSINTLRKREHVYFISNRLSEDDKFDVFKVTPIDREPPLVIVRGHMSVIGNPNQKKARITVINVSNGEQLGVFQTNSYTGNYVLILAPNVKYVFKVEVTGYGTLSEDVEVPLKIDYEVCYQEMIIKLNEKQRPVIRVSSYFTDEHEKVFYMRSQIDTSKHLANMYQFSGGKTVDNPNLSRSYSTVDELVKKQLEEEKKKPAEALKLFKEKNYEQALQLYSQLAKNDPGDPFVNYYLGICHFKLGTSRTKAISSLHIASNCKDVPSDVFLYLGRSYHLSYMFQNALWAFEEFKKKANPAELNAAEIPQLMKNCQSGQELMNDQVNMEVLKRTDVKEKDMLSFYDPDIINDALQYKTDFFKTPIDKKKLLPQIITNFHHRDFIHVSYGSAETNRLDLYSNKPLPNGKPSPSKSLGPDVNTSLDENYPYLSRDGLSLYFSSKGHNSMGGYDIFKCTRPDTNSAWSKPQNLGYPINSTYDDILFIPDSTENYASMCSNRKNGQFEYLQVRTPKKTNALSIIKGQFSTNDSLGFREAYITVTDAGNGEIAGVYKSNSETGQYLMILASGHRYEMTVEYEGNPEFKAIFDLPEKKGDHVLKQTIKYTKEDPQKKFKLKNYFSENEASRINFESSQRKVTEIVSAIDLKPNGKGGKAKRTVEEQKKDEEDLKSARTLYAQANYQEASLLFATVDAHTDLSGEDLYYYGVCLFHSRKDKTYAIEPLEKAALKKDIPADVHYYAAKANYYSYRFSTAISHYNKLQELSKPETLKELNIEKEIEHCNNCIRLVNNPVVLEVFERKHVDHLAFQNSLTHIESGARVLLATEDMRSLVDKKKNYKPLIYLTPDKNTVVYSSYGEGEGHDKDIYMLKKMASGKWGAPQLVQVNSTFDEEFPALSKDGQTLYFSSKGFNGMGGYDIYKSVWNETTATWSAPVNMGAPVNSPYDDMYFLE